MIKKALIYLLMVGMGVLGAYLTASAVSLQSAYARNVDKVFRIDIYKEGRLAGSGSGVLVEWNGGVLTAYHVVDNLVSTDTIKAVEINGIKHECKVQRFDATRDLALLSCDGLSARMPVRRSSSLKLAVGDRVFHIGAPRGLTLLLTDGIVAQKRESKGDILITALGAPGSSGGPIFNSAGNLVGIVQRCYIGFEWGSNALIMASPLRIDRFLRGER